MTINKSSMSILTKNCLIWKATFKAIDSEEKKQGTYINIGILSINLILTLFQTHSFL